MKEGGGERLGHYLGCDCFVLEHFLTLHSAFRRMQRCDKTDADAGNIALLTGQTFGGNSVY